MGLGAVVAGSSWLTEPRRPQWLREKPKAYRYALATVCIGAFMGQLDASVVTVAFPSMQRSFHSSLAAVTLVGLSYLVVLVAGVTAVGRFSDSVGRKLVYTYGFAVFSFGSALCALAPSLLALDGARLVQGLGAAMLQANSLAILYLVLPKERLGRGLGIQGACQALGLALGPTVGGLLLAAGGWRLIFLVNVPAGMLGVLAARLCLPRSADLTCKSQFDWGGLALLAPAVVAPLVALSFASAWGWWSPAMAVLVAVAVASTAWLIRHERRVASPLVDIAIFRKPSVATGMASALLSYLVLFGVMFAVPFFLERGRHLGTGSAGLILTALPLSLGCVAPYAGRLSDRIGGRRPAAAGMAVTAAALAAAGLAEPTGWVLAACLAVAGAGLGLFVSPNTAGVMSSVRRSQAGVMSGLLNMTRGLGTAMGLALTGLVLSAGAGRAVSSAGVGRGYEPAMLTLALLSLVAAGLTSRRPAAC
ncbi:MAG TPA: MFS transporter, partial [Acidimicrobiales bacterium]|nr:MFS transporter [Acidimicrobiales bacterium]